jgi:hypothetical protein
MKMANIAELKNRRGEQLEQGDENAPGERSPPQYPPLSQQKNRPAPQPPTRYRTTIDTPETPPMKLFADRISS